MSRVKKMWRQESGGEKSEAEPVKVGGETGFCFSCMFKCLSFFQLLFPNTQSLIKYLCYHVINEVKFPKSFYPCQYLVSDLPCLYFTLGVFSLLILLFSLPSHCRGEGRKWESSCVGAWRLARANPLHLKWKGMNGCNGKLLSLITISQKFLCCDPIHPNSKCKPSTRDRNGKAF